MDKRRACISIFLVLLGIGACIWTSMFSKKKTVIVESTESTETVQTEIESAETTKELYPVYICGEVISPGIYELDGPVYLYELIEIAGGFTPSADEKHIDRVYLIDHAQSIYIPSEDDMSDSSTTHDFYSPYGETGSPGEDNGGKAHGRVNINTAEADELATLPGIGMKTAQKIIEYRETNGRFNSIEEIMNVSGIGESKFEKIKNCIFTG